MFVIKHFTDPVARRYEAVECSSYSVEWDSDGVWIHRDAGDPIFVKAGEEAYIENAAGRTIDALRPKR